MKNKIKIDKVVGCTSRVDGGVKQSMVGEDVGFDRIRRITGYLVGTADRFGDSKAAELRNRVKHG